MFKKNIDYGLVFIIKAKNRFSSGIHTSFMKFNIDVYFLDENLKIFDIQTLKPWEKYTPLKKADYIIEFEENKIKNKYMEGEYGRKKVMDENKWKYKSLFKIL